MKSGNYFQNGLYRSQHIHQTGQFPPQIGSSSQVKQFSSQPGQLQPGMNLQPGQFPPQIGDSSLAKQFSSQSDQLQPGMNLQPGQFPPQIGDSSQVNQFSSQPGQLQPGMNLQPGQFPPQIGDSSQAKQFSSQPGQLQPGMNLQPGQFPPQIGDSSLAKQFSSQSDQFQPGMNLQPGQFPPQIEGSSQVKQFSSQPGQLQPGMNLQPGQFPPQIGGSSQVNRFSSQPGLLQSGMNLQPGQFPPQIDMFSNHGMYNSQPSSFLLQPGGFPSQPDMHPPTQQPRQRLDPDMMPSVVQVIDDDKNSRSGIFSTGYPTAELPPLVTTDIIAQDQGNCNPKFIRSTVYAVPQNQDIVKNSHLPISLSISPIAALNSQEISLPVVDLGEIGPVRCQRCKAYICSFMEFIDGGRKFRCPFCKAATTVEDNYFAHLDHTGRRTDIAYRPELCLGSYEFAATKQYCKNGIKPKEPAFIFMLDVSYNAVRNGLVELFCRNIVELLRNLPKDYGMDKSAIKIGLATYDNLIHFYKLSDSGNPSMLIVNDMQDVFAPLADGFLVDFDQAESSLVSCLNEIATNFLDTRVTETILGPVIQAGLDALRNVDRSGKLFIFHTSLPTLECPGQLKNREDRKLLGTDKEKTVLSCGNEFYTKLGEECVKFGCCVDFFLFPNSFIDVATFTPVSHLTGGSIYKYQYFDCSTDGVRFLNDLKHDIQRDIIFDVMMRVRTSTGIRPTGFYGSFYMQNTTDIEVSAIDENKSMQVELKYDDKLDEKGPVYIQVAVLFTSCSGQRRLRIHNLSLSVSNDYNQIYRLTDEDATITHLFKHAERIVREKSQKEMREYILSTCAYILSTYREKCSESAPLGQLILPECLKLLPIHSLCITKNDALTGGSELTVDDRAWMMSIVPSMSVADVSAFLYPRIYSITNLGSSDSKILNQIRSSNDYFQQNESYLIENSMFAFIWIGIGVSRSWLKDIFNVDSFQQLDSEKHDLPQCDNDNSRALCKLLSNLNAGRPMNLKLFIIKQQEGLESWMKKFLVEDRYASNSNSYVEFLCELHREIRKLLA